MRTLFTEIINSLSVDGKFVQDKFIIGNGKDEIITFKLDESNAAIRYIPDNGGNLEYTNDGITWNKFNDSPSSSLEYEPIEFTESNLNDGILQINHNFNNANVLCLGYSVTPKDITYQDNSIIFDYSDQNAMSGAVWFIGSKQDMIQNMSYPEYDSNVSAINISYVGNTTDQTFSFTLQNNSNGSFQNIDTPDYVVDKCFCEGSCCIDGGVPIITVGNNSASGEVATKNKVFIMCGSAIAGEFCVIGYIEDSDGIKFNKEYNVIIEQGCLNNSQMYPKTIILSPKN